GSYTRTWAAIFGLLIVMVLWFLGIPLQAYASLRDGLVSEVVRSLPILATMGLLSTVLATSEGTTALAVVGPVILWTILAVVILRLAIVAMMQRAGRSVAGRVAATFATWPIAIVILEGLTTVLARAAGRGAAEPIQLATFLMLPLLLPLA